MLALLAFKESSEPDGWTQQGEYKPIMVQLESLAPQVNTKLA
jgi:hypothetical protein